MVSITAAPRTSARSGALMALGSMSCVQLGLAVSVHLFGEVGPLGAAWLRLAWAAVILLAAVRPRPWRFRRPVLLATVALGIATGGVTMLFMLAVARLPLVTVSALEFLGPLGVAVAPSGLEGVELVEDRGGIAVIFGGGQLDADNAACTDDSTKQEHQLSLRFVAKAD